MPTVVPHQPGHSPVSPTVRALALPAPRPSPQRRDSRDSRGLMTPQTEHQAPSCCEVDGSEASCPGRRQWPQKGGGWARPRCRPRKPSHVSQQRQSGNPRVSQTLMWLTQHREGAALVCGQRAPKRHSTCKMEPAGHVPLPTKQEATTLGKQVPGTDRGTAQGPWWAGSEATRLYPQACVPPMPPPHPMADTIPLVGWPDARWAPLHAEHVHRGLRGAEEPAEAQEGAHGHGRRRPPVLGQSMGRVRAVLTPPGRSWPLPKAKAPRGAKKTPPEAGMQGSREGLRWQTTHCTCSQSPPDLCAQPPTGTLMTPHRHSCLTSPTPEWQC